MWFLPLFVLVWLAESKSSGIITTGDVSLGCDWEAVVNKVPVIKNWGCQTRKWNQSNDISFARGFCQDPNFNTGKFMWWTGAPEPVDRTEFSMRTGNGDPTKDPTTYVADRYLSVYIKALQFDTLYKGLLLFAKEDKAVNASKVGDWIVPQEASPQFASYPTQMCPRSVMHFNAEDKPYVVKFNFLAPPSGTGTIRIKAILKTGPPNPTDFGQFLIMPDIILTEAQPQDTKKWVLLPNGTSCAKYCSDALQPDCNDAALGTSMDGIQPNPLDSIYPCHGALFHDCTGNPRVRLPERFCTYPGSECPKPTTAKCDAVPDASTPMFCICGAPLTGSPTAAPTVPGSKDNEYNPAASSSSNVMPSIGALIGMLSLGLWNSKSSLTLGMAALMFAAAPLASAHNWMEGTRGRASNLGANQFCSPAFPQVNRQNVHMQVAAGQPFVVEWASAHGDSTYWIIIHDNARANVSKLTRGLMNSWLDACPGGGLANTTDDLNRRYHRFRPNKNLKSTGPVNGASANAPSYADLFYPEPIFNGTIWNAFSLNGGRPNTFYNPTTGMINCNNGADTIPGFNCSANPKTMLARYKESDLSGDRRCSYTNSTNPWIHTIHRYSHRDVSDGYATALMQVPDNLPAGRYQLHYKWSSYCDTIDIDVKAKGMTVVNPYGTPITPTEIQYDIAQHCLFEKPRKVGQCVEVVTTPQQCAALCNSDTACRGFQLLPLQFDNSNGNSFGLFPESSFIPWTDITKSNRSSFCEKSQFVNTSKPGRMVCFTVTQFQDDFNSARPLWSFTDDTNHQGFYGTCYIKPALRNFTAITRVEEDQHTDYRFLSKCIPCNNIGQDLTNPRWGPQQDFCTDCSKNPVAPLKQIEVPKWASTVGPGTFNQTSHWLSPGGTPYAFQDECILLAMNDPRCSKYVMYSDFRAQRNAGKILGVKPSDVRLNSQVALINGTSSWHYSRGTLNHSYFRTCACLDKDVADSLAGSPPIIDTSMYAKACDGATAAQCVYRNFTVYTLS